MLYNRPHGLSIPNIIVCIYCIYQPQPPFHPTSVCVCVRACMYAPTWKSLRKTSENPDIIQKEKRLCKKKKKTKNPNQCALCSLFPPFHSLPCRTLALVLEGSKRVKRFIRISIWNCSKFSGSHSGSFPLWFKYQLYFDILATFSSDLILYRYM